MFLLFFILVLLSLWFGLPYTASQLVCCHYICAAAAQKNTFHTRRIVNTNFNQNDQIKIRFFCFHYLSIPHPKILEKCKCRVIVESAHGFSKSTAISNGAMGSIDLMRARICTVIIYHSMMVLLRWFEFQLQFLNMFFAAVSKCIHRQTFMGYRIWFFPSATIWHSPVVYR